MSKLILTNGTYERITEYVRAIDAEIGIFGYVKMIDADFVVDQVFLVEQQVSGSSVDFADSGLEYAINRAVEDDRIDDLKFCCHSHVDMGAFWSKTDEDMIEGMNNGMTPYLVSLVINKKHETEQRVDFYNPVGPLGDFTRQVRYDLDLEIERAESADIKAEIESLVTQARSTWYDHGYTRKPYSRRQSRWLPEPTQVSGQTQLPVLNAAGDITGWADSPMTEDEMLEMADELGNQYGWDTAWDIIEAIGEGGTNA